MLLKSKFHSVLMDSAFLWANLSTCKRRQVGCVIAKDSRILSTGYNGTISNMDNCCEYTKELDCLHCKGTGLKDVIKYQKNRTIINETLECTYCTQGKITTTVTKESVLHAEQNALMYALRQGISTHGATLYCTDAPCVICAKLIAQAGITKVFYNREYHDNHGLELLASAGVMIQQLLNALQVDDSDLYL